MTSVVACALTTDLSGYAGPEVSGPQEAGDATESDTSRPTEALDAMTMDTSTPDTYRALVLSDRPSAYWRFEETTSVAKDEVGAHDGTYSRNVQHVDGVLPGTHAASFDSASTIIIGDAFGFTGAAPFTLEIWAAPTAASGNPACMIAKDTPNEGGSIQDGWAFYVGDSNELIGARWSGASEQSARAAALPSNVFSHVVMTYDGMRIALYVDGALVGDGASASSMASITSRLVLGGSRDGTGCFFHGVLDEIAIYNRVLPVDRIRAHHAAAAP